MKGLIINSCRFLTFAITVAAAVSCGKEQSDKPEYILGRDQMVQALAEVYIAEQKVSRLSLNPDSAALVFGSLEKKVFENLNVPDSVFRASVDYYMDHPREMEIIYAALVDSLQLRQQRVPFASEQ